MGDWLPCGLATYYLIAAWLTSSLPFQFLRDARARFQAGRDAGQFLGTLVTCPTCLSAWVAGVVYGLYQVPAVGAPMVYVTAAAGVCTALFRPAAAGPEENHESDDRTDPGI